MKIENTEDYVLITTTGRTFKINTPLVINVSARTTKYFIIHTAAQNHILDVSNGCQFIQGVIDETTDDAYVILGLWQYQ